MSRRESSRYDDYDDDEEVFDEFDDYEDDGFVVNDEEDEDEDGEEEYSRGPSSKKSKINRNIFIDDIAEDSEGEEEEDYDEEEDGFVEYDNDIAELPSRPSYQMRPAYEEEESAEVLAARLHEKYSTFSAVEEDSAPQSELLPAPGDPMIWMIKCKAQREKDILVAVYKRYAMRVDTAYPIHITSAFYRDHQKGYLYFEANNVSDVQAAINGITDIYSGTLKLISRKEMVDVIQIKKRKVDLKKGDWCRVSRGKFAGDLCQILDVSDNMESAVVKLVPRIDLDDGKTASGVGTVKKKGVVRPKQKLFDRKLVETKTRGIVQKRGAYLLHEKDRYRDGFLEKEVKVTTLITQDVIPTVDELTMFAPPRADNDSRAKIEAPSKRTVDVTILKKRFTIGDRVKVIQRGSNIIGVIDNMINDEIIIRPSNRPDHTITVPIFNIRRHFEEGEHIKVISGLSQGESGIVIGIKGERIRIVTDVNSKEIEVHANDVGGKAAKLDDKKQESPFNLYDFVQLDYQTVGLVIKLGIKYLKVIDQNGTTKNVEAAITTPIHNKVKPFAMDSNRVPMNIGDRVQMLKAENRFGVILQIHNTVAFVRYEGEGEDLGIRVEKTDTLKSMVRTSFKNSTNNSRVKQEFRAPPSDLTVPKPAQGGFKPGFKRRDPLIDKTVVIRAGLYKGYKGVIKEVFPTTVRIEMLGNARVVTINKNAIEAFDHPYQQGQGTTTGASNSNNVGWGGAASVRGGWGTRTATNSGGNHGLAGNESTRASSSTSNIAWNKQSRQSEYNSSSAWRNNSEAASWGNADNGSVSTSRNSDRNGDAWSSYRGNQASQYRPEPSPWKSKANVDDSRSGDAPWSGASTRNYPTSANRATDSVAWGGGSKDNDNASGEWSKPARNTTSNDAWASSSRPAGTSTNPPPAWDAPSSRNNDSNRSYRPESRDSASRGSSGVNWGKTTQSSTNANPDSNWSNGGGRGKDKDSWNSTADNSYKGGDNGSGAGKAGGWSSNSQGNHSRSEIQSGGWGQAPRPQDSDDRGGRGNDRSYKANRERDYSHRHDNYNRDSYNQGSRSGGENSRNYSGTTSNYTPREPQTSSNWSQPARDTTALPEINLGTSNPWATQSTAPATTSNEAPEWGAANSKPISSAWNTEKTSPTDDTKPDLIEQPTGWDNPSNQNKDSNSDAWGSSNTNNQAKW